MNCKRKVLIVFPGILIKNDEGSKHRLMCHVEEYNRHGYEVTVLAFCKDALFSVDKKYLSDNAKWVILPFPLPIAKSLLFAKSLQFYMKTVVALLSWLKGYSFIQFEQWGLWSPLCKNGIKYITDVHGDLANECKETHRIKRNIVNYFYKLQKEFTKSSDCCIVVSENLKKQIELNSGETMKDYAIISCGVDYSKFSQAKKQELDGIDLEERIVLGYCGGFQYWQNFEEMIDIAQRLRRIDERVFLLVFSNDNSGPYKKQLELLGERNYFIKGLASHEVPGHLKLMDAGFLLRSDLILNKVSSPTKICEYLAAGVPLICTQYSGDYERSVVHGYNGFVGKEPHFTDEEIESLYKWLITVKENRSKMAEECQRSVIHRTFEEEFNEYIKINESV